MDFNTLLPWLLLGAGVLILLVVMFALLRSWSATRERLSQQQSELASKLAQIQSGTDEAVRLARDALTTSVTSIQSSTVSAQETRQALETMSHGMREDREELRQTLVRAMEDNRAVNRAVVIAVQGIADTAKEELSITRSAAAYMSEVVKALQGVSADLGDAATALREANTGRAGRLHELEGHNIGIPALEGPGGDTVFSQGDGAPGNVGGDGAQGASTTPEDEARAYTRARGSYATGGPRTRPRLPNDIVEVLQLYASSFTGLVLSYQSARPLSDAEIEELAATYYTTWVSRLRSLRDRSVPREVWQRFYMYAIAVQTMNNFASQLDGPNLELAIRFWEKQAQQANVPMHIFLKMTEIMRRQAHANGSSNGSELNGSNNGAGLRDDHLANAS